jgi:hypothetical protein
MIRKLALFAAFVLALLATTRTARAEPLRILVAVGHRLGVPGEAPLKHAVRDATRMRDVFVQVGDVRPENALLVVEPTEAQLFAALDKAAAIAKTRRPEEVTLVFYFSGHGDRERIHLGGERVALRDVDAKLAATPASLRIVVADACRTAEVRGKGVTDDEPFAITLGGTSGASGVVRIHASADGEVAQESDELGGAVFTHYFTTGLAGAADADGDARVTLAEAYAFAYGQTLFRSARAAGVIQRPAAQFDLREAAPIVLTRTNAVSAIRLPRATDVHYLVYGVGSRTVVGELWSSPDRVVALAVAPGKYIVQRRAGGRSAAAQIDVGRGQQRDLSSADFRAVPEEVLAKKGGDLLLRPNELSLGYALETTRFVDVGHELALRYAYAWDTFAIGVGATGGLGVEDTNGQRADMRWLGVDATLELRVRLGDVLVRAGAGPRVVGMLQTLRRDDAARVARASYDGERESRATLAGAHAVVGGRLSLGDVLFVEVDARGEALVGKREGDTLPVWGVGGGASAGVSF